MASTSTQQPEDEEPEAPMLTLQRTPHALVDHDYCSVESRPPLESSPAKAGGDSRNPAIQKIAYRTSTGDVIHVATRVPRLVDASASASSSGHPPDARTRPRSAIARRLLDASRPPPDLGTPHTVYADEPREQVADWSREKDLCIIDGERVSIEEYITRKLHERLPPLSQIVALPPSTYSAICAKSAVLVARVHNFARNVSQSLGAAALGTPFACPTILTSAMLGVSPRIVRRAVEKHARTLHTGPLPACRPGTRFPSEDGQDYGKDGERREEAGGGAEEKRAGDGRGGRTDEATRVLQGEERQVDERAAPPPPAPPPTPATSTVSVALNDDEVSTTSATKKPTVNRHQTRRTRIPPHVRVAVVKDYLANGVTQNECSRKYKVKPSYVQFAVKRFRASGVFQGVPVAQPPELEEAQFMSSTDLMRRLGRYADPEIMTTGIRDMEEERSREGTGGTPKEGLDEKSEDELDDPETSGAATHAAASGGGACVAVASRRRRRSARKRKAIVFSDIETSASDAEEENREKPGLGDKKKRSLSPMEDILSEEEAEEVVNVVNDAAESARDAGADAATAPELRTGASSDQNSQMEADRAMPVLQPAETPLYHTAKDEE